MVHDQFSSFLKLKVWYETLSDIDQSTSRRLMFLYLGKARERKQENEHGMERMSEHGRGICV